MASSMTLRSGNPALTAYTFAKYRAVPGEERMTLGGTVNKTALSLIILLATATYIWGRGADDPTVGAWILVSVVAGLVVALVTVFKPTLAAYTTPVYAALEGLALGACWRSCKSGGARSNSVLPSNARREPGFRRRAPGRP